MKSSSGILGNENNPANPGTLLSSFLKEIE
jgi:hypothetical protein